MQKTRIHSTSWALASVFALSSRHSASLRALRSSCVVIVAFLVSAMAAGCPGLVPTIDILAVLAIEEGDCDPDPDSVYLERGLFDVLGFSYDAPLLIESAAEVTLEEVVIWYSDDADEPIPGLARRDVPSILPVQGRVPPMHPHVQRLSMFDEFAAANLDHTEWFDNGERSTLHVTLELYGSNGVRSSEFSFPIELCYQCLIGVGADRENEWACLDPSTSLVVYDVCHPGQEELQSRCE